MNAVRLSDREAARVTALAILAVLCLVPSVLRWIAPAPPPPPQAICETAGRVGEDVVCGSGTALGGVPGLWAGVRLDLNRATAADLEVVPGIGPRLAERIVADRRQHGPFEHVGDVQRVRGIGPRLEARLSAYVTVRRSRP